MKDHLKGFINMNHYINEIENELGLSVEDKLDLPLENTDITVHFRNLDKKLIEYISDADGVLGAVAWLNHEAILKELAKKEVVSIVFAYYEEWCKIFTFSETFNWKSEPLDWKSKGIKREFKTEK